LLVPLVSALPVNAAVGPAEFCGPGSGSNASPCVITPTDATHLRIDGPFVAGPFYEYKKIVFNPGDEITLDAGGCVQTGGLGDTWKRFVNPRGDDSGFPDGKYWGWVTIPGAVFSDNPNKVVNQLPFSSFLGGAQHNSFRIPPNLKLPPNATRSLNLTIGYKDGDYSDNSYLRHDNGNDNQCALDRDGGNAWVNVSVRHGVTGPWPATHPLPFDLVQTDLDSNLMFKNPVWGWQSNGSPIDSSGNFYQACHEHPVPELCTSQAVSEDHLGWNLLELGGLCGGDPPLPHVNWFDVTYTGNIEWDEWAKELDLGDDDYNLKLRTDNLTGPGTGPAGATKGNPDFVKLEFDSDETVDHYQHQPWWRHFRDSVSHPGTPDTPEGLINGHFAVVVGLMGIDAVHDPGGAEIHPVHVLAIRESAPGSVDPANDSWAIFARNWGNEGECGSQQHYLDLNRITIDLPRPDGVPAGAAATLVGNNDFRAHGTDKYPDLNNTDAGMQVIFTLPNGPDKPWEAGELHLNWTGAAPAAAPASAPQAVSTPNTAARPAAPDEEPDPNEPEAKLRAIFDGMTPEQQQTAREMFARFRPPPVEDAETVGPARLTNVAPPVPTSVPTVSHAPDPLATQRRHAQFQSLCAATGGNLPTQPTWCAMLNQPPVTTLRTTGGTAGPDGWLSTPVTATLTAFDATGSGIDHTEYSYDGQTWTPYTGPFTLPDGTYAFAYRSQDNKGNLEETRQQAFKIDTRAPVITINQPAATPYPHSSTLTLDYGVTDGPAAGLGAGSGVASVRATMDGSTTLAGHGLASGQTINLLTELPAGTHTFTVEATDTVAHTAATSVTVNIVVTPESIEEDVRQFHNSGDINSAVIAASLLAQLEVAETAWNLGNCLAANAAYAVFRTQVHTLSGIAITPTAANILIDDANYLIAHCGKP
jgi:hypothetical protein